MKKIISILLILFCLSSCSGGGSNEVAIDGKNLSLAVTNSRSFNPDIDHGKIDYYQVTITAPDIQKPIVERYEGDSTAAKMMGIPSGESRTILVEAINPNGLVIRRGEKEGISIIPGKTTQADISMNSVPIFTNLRDKAAVSGTRIRFDIFGEPDSELEVLNLTQGTETFVIDQSTGSTILDTSNDEGLFSLSPQEFETGAYTFQIRDKKTGESTTVNVTFLESTIRPGLMVNTGGSVSKKGGETTLVTLGQPYYRPPNPNAGHLGNETLLDVMEVIY